MVLVLLCLLNSLSITPSRSTHTALKHYLQNQDMEATQVPTNKRVDKTVVVFHIYNGILLHHKKRIE